MVEHPRTASRLIGIGVVTLLLATACSSEAEESVLSPTAVAVLARVDEALGEQAPLDPDELVVPEGCRLVIETDEYNFETEVVVCDEEPATTTTSTSETTEGSGTTVPPTTAPFEPPSIVEWMGSSDARSLARRLRRALIQQSGCESPQDLIALENLAALTPLEIRDLFLAATQDLRRSAELCNLDVAGWRDALEDSLDHLADITVVLEAGDE